MEVLNTIEEFAWIGWLVLILVFLVIEMLSLDFTFVMLAIGSLAGLGTHFLGAPVWVQVIVAAAVALLLIFLLRPPLLRHLRHGGDPTPTNIEAVLGLSGRVLTTVTMHEGQVKLANGEIWSARSDIPAHFEPGTSIRVSRIDGATAFVRAPDQEPT